MISVGVGGGSVSSKRCFLGDYFIMGRVVSLYMAFFI